MRLGISLAPEGLGRRWPFHCSDTPEEGVPLPFYIFRSQEPKPGAFLKPASKAGKDSACPCVMETAPQVQVSIHERDTRTLF